MPDAIRVFEKKDIVLNFSADFYISMIDWKACRIKPSPLLSHISSCDLNFSDPVYIAGLPCHSQAVERCVNNTSASTCKVYGRKSRHGMIILSKKARLEMPRVETKSDFK